MICIFSLATLAGCVLPGRDGEEEDTVRPVTTQRLVERDVEAPEVFKATGRGVWDGRPSLGGVWVAHPETTDPERVIIRNVDNGQFVIGALFRRDASSVGPAVQVSSDAAEALGMLAGTPATLNITALRREDGEDGESREAATPSAAQLPADQLPADPTSTGLPATTPIATAALEPAAPDLAEIAIPAQPATAAAPKTSSLSKPFIQIGIFSQEQNAKNTATSLRGIGASPTVNRQETAGKVFYRVTVGPAATEAEAAELLTKVKALGFEDAYFVSG